MGGKRESYGLMNTRTVDEEKSGRRKSLVAERIAREKKRIGKIISD